MAVFAPYILPQERGDGGGGGGGGANGGGGDGGSRRHLDVQRAQGLVAGAGIVVMALWTRSILFALEESAAAAAAAAAPAGVGEVLYLLFVYAMWLLSLASLLLPHLRLVPDPDVGYVAALAALATSALIWLVVWFSEFVDGLCGVGEWAWRSPGWCFLVLVFLRALHLAVP